MTDTCSAGNPVQVFVFSKRINFVEQRLKCSHFEDRNTLKTRTAKSANISVFICVEAKRSYICYYIICMTAILTILKYRND